MSEETHETPGTITVDGVDYEVPEKFTLGELADIEEIIGQGYDPEKPGGARSTLAVIWIAMRRKNPQLRLEDVRNLDAELIAVEQEAEERPPAQEPSEQPDDSAIPVISGTQH